MKVSEEYLKAALEDAINANTRLLEWLKKEDFSGSAKNDLFLYHKGQLDAFDAVMRML